MTSLRLVWSRPEPVHDQIGSLVEAHVVYVASACRLWLALWGIR